MSPLETRPFLPAHGLLAAGCALLVLAIGARPALAQNVMGPASDILTTPAGGNTIEQHFDAGAGGAPLPAGFFGPGSDPFNGTVTLHGRPLDGTPLGGSSSVGLPGQADTIVKRWTVAVLSSCPSTATVPIEIVALNLVSVQPITVTFGGGATTTTWEVRGALSSLAPQAQGQMQIRKDNMNGGTFQSFLPVQARLIFTRCTGTAGVSPTVLDPAPAVQLQASGVWSYTDLGTGVMSSPGGVVDHDQNPGTAMVPYLPTSNFYPGVAAVGATCTTPGGPPHKDLTPEQELLAKHGVLPPNRPPGTGFCFGDGSGLACPCLNSGAAGHGCENSFATGGALLYGSGAAKVSADSLLLRIESLPPSTATLLYQGNATLGGGLGIVFGDGLRCAAGLVIRLWTKVSSCGKVNYGVTIGDVPVSVRGAIPPLGGTFYYQGWYRNSAPFCTPSAFNLTNGYQVNWTP